MTPIRLPITSLAALLVIAISAKLIPTAAAQLPDTLKQTYSVGSPTLQTVTWEGYSVAVDGTTAVVGVPLADATEQDSGLARVYNTDSGQLLYTLRVPSAGQQSNFGLAVAISGTRVVLAGSTTSHSVAVFDLASATPELPVMMLPDPRGGEFGNSVAISGTKVVVGGTDTQGPLGDH